MPWYKDGTVSVVQNSNAVTGSGTAFIANSRVGDAFLGPDGHWYEVTNIASDTALAISPNYLGPTTGAGKYALAPMQGYVKDSADALRALVNEFGFKLAALGSTGNYDTLPVAKGGTGGSDAPNARVNLGLGSVAVENIVPVAKGGTGGSDAANARDNLGLGSVAVENIVPVAKGGTGGNTPLAARTGLGLGAAAVAAILGTMTLGGNEALFQLVSNRNGRALKFPDGTMICIGPVPNFYAAANQSTVKNVTFPVPFFSDQYCLTAVGTPVANVDTYGFIYANARSESSAGLVWRNGAQAQTISAGFFMAIGRWF
ncbi:gp53-like domain-containing protein [Pseudomonas graminis]|uniref:Putative tail fiber protein gp53-like C-terminal domain-containing protein n=1 Tax=Pseudomonas graminis TaxID=158627 RepID=A0A6M8MSC7_9PSED|nr:phage tail protein [Pseudomonas graminis]QKF52833.1 hypothetical protein FX982_03825 [Pseudomonas graminis]